MTTRAKRKLLTEGRALSRSCERCPLRDKRVFREFNKEEFAFVQKFKTGELVVEAGSTILLEGHNNPHLYTVLGGWAFRFKSLDDDRRQILSFALPGDFLGLQGPVLKEMQHSVEALTPVTLCVFPRERLWDLYTNHPTLTHDLLWLAGRAEHIADNHLLAVGRRTAVERVAYLLLHLFVRCKALEMNDGRRLELPLTQSHIADALGLSLVHTNKTLRRLIRAKLIAWNRTNLELLDEAKLKLVAKYDEDEASSLPFI